jgi:hypothetical protein
MYQYHELDYLLLSNIWVLTWNSKPSFATNTTLWVSLLLLITNNHVLIHHHCCADLSLDEKLDLLKQEEELVLQASNTDINGNSHQNDGAPATNRTSSADVGSEFPFPIKSINVWCVVVAITDDSTDIIMISSYAILIYSSFCCHLYHDTRYFDIPDINAAFIRVINHLIGTQRYGASRVLTAFLHTSRFLMHMHDLSHYHNK